MKIGILYEAIKTLQMLEKQLAEMENDPLAKSATSVGMRLRQSMETTRASIAELREMSI